MKGQKRKVGRPKLADDTLKKNSIYLVLVSVLLLFILVTTGILTVIKPNNILGSSSYNPYVKINTLTKSPDGKSAVLEFSWSPNNSYKRYAKHYTIYYENANGGLDKKSAIVENQKTVSISKGVTKFKTTGLPLDKVLYLSVKFENGKVINVKFDTKFYYYIKYSGGNNSKGTMSDQKVNYGVKTALYDNKFTKKGYKFDYWIAKNSDGKIYGYDSNGKKGWYKNPKRYVNYIKNKYVVYNFSNHARTIYLTARWNYAAPSKYCYRTKNGKWVFVSKKISTDDNTLLKGIRKDIGGQYSRLCLQTAVTYAVYIMKDGKKPKNLDACKSTRIKNGQYSPKYTNMSNYYKNIINSINSGKPVVIHVHHGGGQHWITVTGYRYGVSTDKMTYKDLFALDPYPKNNTIYHDTIPKLPVQNMSVHSDHDMILWNSKSSACYNNEC